MKFYKFGNQGLEKKNKSRKFISEEWGLQAQDFSKTRNCYRASDFND